MEIFLYISAIVSLTATWFITRKWIPKAAQIGLCGFDMNKLGKPKVAEMGGICVIFGFVMGTLVYIGLQTFCLRTSAYTPVIATLCTTLMACIIGIMDDILGWKVGLRQWQKPIFTLFVSMPMMVINSGHTTMTIPFIGIIDWGILFPLVIVPIGIIGASNAYNLVAGYNGLEAGMGVVIFSTFGYIGLQMGYVDAAALSIIIVAALLAFLAFNWYPAKVFPGDTMTYPVGALAACVAIIGNMERVALVLFLLYACDFLIQAKGGFNKEAFSSVNEDGSLERPYKGVYHITHLAVAVLKLTKKKVYERDVVIFVCGIEIILAILGIYAYQ